MVNGTDLVLYCSGDDTHLGSLGGPRGLAKVVSKQVGNAFPDLDYDNSQIILDHYVCYYAVNDNNASERILNYTAYLEFQPTNINQEVWISKGTSGINGVEQTIANNHTPPIGVLWRKAPTFATGWLLGETMEANDHMAIWIWRRNKPNILATKGSKFRLVLAGDPEPGATETGSGSGTQTLLRALPPPPAIADYRIGLAADFSCNSDGTRTVDNLINENCDLYFFIGNYTYKDTSSCFTEKINPIKAKTLIVFGDQEREQGTPQPALTVAYLQYFVLSKTWYGVVRNSVLFVVMDLYSPYTEGTPQYNDILKILENNKNNPSIKWRIVGTHEPWFTADTMYDAEDDQRRVYWKMFQDNKVDLVIFGHVNNYQRTYPLLMGEDADTPIPVAPELNPNWSKVTDIPNNEIIFVITGDGGRSLHDIDIDDESNAFLANYSNAFHGYSIIEITENAQKLTFKHLNNEGRSLFDIFTITKY